MTSSRLPHKAPLNKDEELAKILFGHRVDWPHGWKDDVRIQQVKALLNNQIREARLDELEKTMRKMEVHRQHYTLKERLKARIKYLQLNTLKDNNVHKN